MPKARWVVLNRFCSRFHTLLQQCKNFGNRLWFDKVTEFKELQSLKVGTFFETQCKVEHLQKTLPQHCRSIWKRYCEQSSQRDVFWQFIYIFMLLFVGCKSVNVYTQNITSVSVEYQAPDHRFAGLSITSCSGM